MGFKMLNVRVTDEFREELAGAAEKQGKSLSDFIRTSLEDAVYGKDRIVVEEYEPVGYDYEGLGVDRLLRVLEDKNYNLRDTIDSIRENAESSPKSRKRGADWGV